MDLVIRDNGKVKKVRVYPDLYQTYGIVPVIRNTLGPKRPGQIAMREVWIGEEILDDQELTARVKNAWECGQRTIDPIIPSFLTRWKDRSESMSVSRVCSECCKGLTIGFLSVAIAVIFIFLVKFLLLPLVKEFCIFLMHVIGSIAQVMERFL